MKSSLRRRVFAVLAVLPALAVLACHTAPPQTPPPSPRRVILLSLDGASAHELHRLHDEGAFSAGGFARFFAEGQVAERLIPVNPSLTAPNHISLATGYTADRTEIVGNVFHRPGAPFLETVSGFAAPIETETLWEAARRQGKRAGVMAWPGADDTGPRRRADWGMTYVNTPDREAELVTLNAHHAQVTVGSGPGAQRFDLLAVDRTNDATLNYDGVEVFQARRDGDPARNPTVVSVGTWQDVPCRFSPGGTAPLNDTTA